MSFRLHISLTFVSLYEPYYNNVYSDYAMLSKTFKSNIETERYIGYFHNVNVKYICCEYYINNKRTPEDYILDIIKIDEYEYELQFCYSKFCRDYDNINQISPLYENETEITSERKEIIKKEIIRMFMKSSDSYMKYAYPHNEIHPITCKANDFHLTPLTITTLIDMLDTFVIMGKYDEFNKYVKIVWYIFSIYKLFI